MLRWLLAVSLGLACCGSNVADPDLWGHIQYGREVLQSGTLPKTATWTYLAEDAPWVNHENIAELLLAVSFDQFGTPGLIGLKLLAGMILFGLLIFTARRSGIGWFVICLTCAVVGANIQFHWHYRPQILTYVCLAAMLALLHSIFRDQSAVEFFLSHDVRARMRRLLWAIPLMCIWTNSHGGFAAGLAILMAYHGVVTLHCLSVTGMQHLKSLGWLWGYTLLIVASSVVNPYGFDHWTFMYDALVLPRPEISDWQALSLLDRDAVRFWSLFGLWIAAVMMAIRTARQSSIRSAIWQSLRSGQNMPQWILFALLLWQGMSHCRHMAIVAIVFGFWMPRHLQVVADRWKQMLIDRFHGTHSATHVAMSHSWAVAGSAIVLAACLVRIAHDASDIVVDRTEFPVAAMQYVSEHQLQGRMLVTFNWAQYAIGCFGAPESRLAASRVAVDGRFETCYPRELTDTCFDFWLGDPDLHSRYRSPSSSSYQADAALNLGRPDFVLISKHQRPSVLVIRQSKDFDLLYQDSIAELWGRRSVVATAANDRPSLAVTDGGDQQGFTSFPALPSGKADHVRLTQAVH